MLALTGALGKQALHDKKLRQWFQWILTNSAIYFSPSVQHKFLQTWLQMTSDTLFNHFQALEYFQGILKVSFCVKSKELEIHCLVILIINNVALDNRVEIRGFGSFSKKNIRPRRFINPKTKEESYLGETSIMHFKASKKLLNHDEINSYSNDSEC